MNKVYVKTDTIKLKEFPFRLPVTDIAYIQGTFVVPPILKTSI